MRPSKCRSPIRRPLGTSPCRDEDRLRQLRVWDSRKMAPLFYTPQAEKWCHCCARLRLRGEGRCLCALLQKTPPEHRNISSTEDDIT